MSCFTGKPGVRGTLTGHRASSPTPIQEMWQVASSEPAQDPLLFASHAEPVTLHGPYLEGCRTRSCKGPRRPTCPCPSPCPSSNTEWLSQQAGAHEGSMPEEASRGNSTLPSVPAFLPFPPPLCLTISNGPFVVIISLLTGLPVPPPPNP